MSTSEVNMSPALNMSDAKPMWFHSLTSGAAKHSVYPAQGTKLQISKLIKTCK